MERGWLAEIGIVVVMVALESSSTIRIRNNFFNHQCKSSSRNLARGIRHQPANFEV
jgi:hypothetical protein